MNLLDIFFKNPHISNFKKICPGGAEFYVDRRTDMTKLIVAFPNFTNAPKKKYKGLWRLCVYPSISHEHVRSIWKLKEADYQFQTSVFYIYRVAQKNVYTLYSSISLE